MGLAWSPRGDEILYRRRTDAAAAGAPRRLAGRPRPGPLARQLSTSTMSRRRVASCSRSQTDRTGLVCLPRGESREREVSWLDGVVRHRYFLRRSARALHGGRGGVRIEDRRFPAPLRRRASRSPRRRMAALALRGRQVGPDAPERSGTARSAADRSRVAEADSGRRRRARRGKVPPRCEGLPRVGASEGSGRRVLHRASRRGKAPADPDPRCVKSEAAGRVISPDGDRLLYVAKDRSLRIVPLAGGEAQKVPGAPLEREDYPIQWDADGRTALRLAPRKPSGGGGQARSDDRSPSAMEAAHARRSGRRHLDRPDRRLARRRLLRILLRARHVVGPLRRRRIEVTETISTPHGNPRFQKLVGATR